MDRNFVFTIITALLCLPLVKSLCNDPYCVVCNSAGNICDECETGFTLKNNRCSPCPKNCLTCTADDYCQSCSPGFWEHQCLYTCPINCNEAGCDKISGYCLKCNVSWYGQTCQQERNRCENDQCESLKCSTGCKDGYFGEIYNNVSFCVPCLLFCKQCSNARVCTRCNPGYYINQYNSEVVATCLSCSFLVPNCVDCTYDNNHVLCGSCEEGNVVNEDRYQCVPCPHCQNGCDSEGLCFGGCQPGWTGSKCNYECRSACKTCLNQDACLTCKDGFYTQTCTVSCNTNCQSGNYPRCRFVDGYCSNGCNKGFWGDQCENNCNNNCLDIPTASELCHRNGTCFYWFKSGYMRSDCSTSTSPSPFSSTTTLRASTDERSPVSSTTVLRSTEKNVSISGTTSITQTKPDVNATEAYLQTVSDFQGSLGPAIGGSIAGGFVLGVLAAAVVFYLRERILQKHKIEHKVRTCIITCRASHEKHSQSDTDRHLDSTDIELASASRHCEATLYEMLPEQNKGNIYMYDHLEQPSENEIRQKVGKLGSNVEFYNNWRLFIKYILTNVGKGYSCTLSKRSSNNSQI